MSIPGVDLFHSEAEARGSKHGHRKRKSRLSEFTAIGRGRRDQSRCRRGSDAQILISWGDTFLDGNETLLTFGFNNDFLAYFPIDGCDEGILFINHEYASPFYQHGFKPLAPLRDKTPTQIQIEQDSVGNSFLHVQRNRNGSGTSSGLALQPADLRRPARFAFTGPRAGDTSAPNIGDSATASVGNCSGGITPWGTAMSCEENYDGYGLGSPSARTRATAGRSSATTPTRRTRSTTPWPTRSTGGSASTTRTTRRQAQEAHRAGPLPPREHGLPPRAGQGVRALHGRRQGGRGPLQVHLRPPLQARQHNRRHNEKILESGKLYIARFEPEGRRRFTNVGDVVPINPTEGTGTWVEVLVSELHDTATMLRARIGTAEYDLHFAVNRCEDVEVAEDGRVYLTMTNNSGVKDSHGAVRRILEDGNDPLATSFAWQDFAAGGPPSGGGQGFSSPDNLTFDDDGNLWVVTDISSSRLNKVNEYQYHGNNAMFMVPTRGPNAGIAYRFANMPVESEGTGPYFTPDNQTLFVCVQHPGEETGTAPTSVFGDPATYNSWWPARQPHDRRRPRHAAPVASWRSPGSAAATTTTDRRNLRTSPDPPGSSAARR